MKFLNDPEWVANSTGNTTEAVNINTEQTIAGEKVFTNRADFQNSVTFEGCAAIFNTAGTHINAVWGSGGSVLYSYGNSITIGEALTFQLDNNSSEQPKTKIFIDGNHAGYTSRIGYTSLFLGARHDFENGNWRLTSWPAADKLQTGYLCSPYAMFTSVLCRAISADLTFIFPDFEGTNFQVTAANGWGDSSTLSRYCSHAVMMNNLDDSGFFSKERGLLCWGNYNNKVARVCWGEGRGSAGQLHISDGSSEDTYNGDYQVSVIGMGYAPMFYGNNTSELPRWVQNMNTWF